MTAPIRFIPVGEITRPLTISVGLSGASGTGKTYSALLIARGIAEARGGGPVAVVDTENCRALAYRQAFPEMLHFDMRAVEGGEVIGFGPERWIEVIDAAEQAGAKALVIDSFSHSWEGVGGVLDLKEQVLDRIAGPNADGRRRDSLSMLAWAEIKPRYRRLIDRIVRAEIATVICTRAKPVVMDPKKGVALRKTKTRKETIPWDPASDAELLFEMTAMVMLDPSAKGCPVWPVKVSDEHSSIFRPNQMISVETGRALVAWADGDRGGEREKELLDAARAMARSGGEALSAHWKAADANTRAILRQHAAELRTLADHADSAGDDPFEKSAEEDGQSPEEIERAMREAKEAADKAAKEED